MYSEEKTMSLKGQSLSVSKLNLIITEILLFNVISMINKSSKEKYKSKNIFLNKLMEIFVNYNPFLKWSHGLSKYL